MGIDPPSKNHTRTLIDILPGVRWRIPGKGKQGFEIKVYRESGGLVIFRHDSSETYRKNSEVEYWIKRIAVLLENDVPIPALWDLDNAIRKFRERTDER